jgi:hypothetical protein
LLIWGYIEVQALDPGVVATGLCKDNVSVGQSHEVRSLVETYRETYFRL